MTINKIAVAAVIILASLNCFAQAERADSDLSGVWILNLKETTFESMPAESDEPERNAEITHDGPKVTITKWDADEKPGQARRAFVYYTDKRGETNVLGPSPTKTRWDGNKLVIKAVNKDRTEHVEEWYLSKDRKKLFQKVMITYDIAIRKYGRTTGFVVSKYKYTLVFDRAPVEVKAINDPNPT